MFDKSACREKERHCSEGYPINRESTSTSRMRTQQDYSHLAISASESSIGNHGMGTTTTTRASAEHHGEYYPSQVPNVSSPSSLDDDNAEQIVLQEQATSPPVMESSSEDMPASRGSSRENLEQNSTAIDPSSSNNDPNYMTLKKKSKSKKILRMLKGSGKSMRGFKKPSSSDQSSSTFTASTANGGGVPTYSNSKKSPKSSSKSFSFPYVFHKQPSSAPSLQTIDCAPPRSPIGEAGTFANDPSNSISLSRKFENMAGIIRVLDNSCSAIEKNLMKTFSQKMADWALYPWSASKESALASVTQSFRSELRLMNSADSHNTAVSLENMRFPILNPVDPSELLTSVDADECFILPSAHFPLLLCFNSEHYVGSPKKKAAPQSKRQMSQEDGGSSGDTLYRARV